MKFKARFSLLLAVVLFLLPTTTAFASESGNENYSIQTISITVPGKQDIAIPYIWGEFYPGLSDNVSYSTSSFYIPDRYFAYEISATAVDGSAVNQSFSVALMLAGAIKASSSAKANGTVVKNDWISVVPDYYYFRITNSTSVSINVQITYYSWK